MEEPMVIGKVLRKRFQLSSLSPEEKQRLGSYIKQLGGTYLDKQIFIKQVTHVVCGEPNRGEKYLSGCVSGRWVLKKDFIEDSFRHGKWLCEEEYEWRSEILVPHSPLVALYDAPKKWRMALKNNEGAFQNWNAIVLVRDNKMKKAYERLLEAGSATISKKKAPFMGGNLHNEITHVFVENDMKSEVQHFESGGIPCITPDYIAEYIIQVPKEHASSKFILKGSANGNYNALKSIKMPVKSKRTSRGVMPGKENGPVGIHVTETTASAAGKRGKKRQAPDCQLCAAKRQKKQNELFPHNGASIARNKDENTRSRASVYPTYVSSIVESCVDEGYILLALDSISASLSKRYAPSSRCLHMIMKQFLLDSPSKNQAVRSYHLLNQILSLHPPASCQILYLKALEEPGLKHSTDEEYSSPWQFVSKVVRCSLEAVSSDGETNRIQENAGLLLQFFDNLFKQDANATLPHQTPTLVQILWPAGKKTKDAIKQIVKLSWKSVTLAIHDSSKLIVCQVLLDMLSLAVTSKKRVDVSGSDCEFLVQQLFLVSSKTGSNEATKLLLEKSHSTWLKMRIAELILGNFDKSLIPQVHRLLIDKTLSLNKIVSCYFFLLPKISENVETMPSKKHNPSMADRKQIVQNRSVPRIDLDDDFDEEEKLPKLKKNNKGETPLHVACIHDNVNKVEDILKKVVDVNATDHAGWTALHEACNYGHLECVKRILEYHERTNRVNLLASPLDGTTVLHDAVRNNHLSVVKLLLKAGGIKLLEAKTVTAKTALDLAVTQEMADFLKVEANRIKQSKQLSLKHKERVHRASDDLYDKVLERQRGKKIVAMEDCQRYLFLVSQLLQGYVKENISTFSNFASDKKACGNCMSDFECWKSLQEHVDNIELHVKRIMGSAQELSCICQLYISTMRLCIA